MTTSQHRPPPFALDKVGTPLSDIAIMIMGPPGGGKSTFIGTLLGRGFVLNTLPAERGAPIVLADKRDRIDIKSVETWDEIEPVYNYLKQGRERTGYDWFALDSFTGLGRLALTKALKERADKGFSQDPARIDKQDWGRVGGFLNDALSKFLGLKMLKVFISQERRYESEELGNSMGPETRPAVLGFLLQSMNGIGRLYSVPLGNGMWERRLRVAQHPNFSTKWQVDPDRRDSFPAVIRNPNLQQILSYCYGTKGKYPAPEAIDESAESANTGFTAL